MEKYQLTDGTPIALATKHIESVAPMPNDVTGRSQAAITMSSGARYVVFAKHEEVAAFLQLLLQNR